MLRAKLPQKHCSEEQLLAFLDCELRPEARRNIQDHLARCWQCRGKMSDLEERAHQLAALLSDSSFLGPERLAEAKDRFLAATGQAPGSDPRDVQFRFLNRPPLSRSLAASWLAVGSVLAAFVAWTLYSQRSPTPAQLLSSAVREEAVFLQEPVHQDFHLNLTAYRPKRITRSGELEIWSDHRAGRFASTWKTDRGELEYAVWQSDSKRRFRYDENLRKGVPAGEVPNLENHALYSVANGVSDFQAVEKRFRTWISTRQWRPILLAEDFSLFVNQQGALLRSERTFSGSRQSITMTATSSHDASRIVMKLELDAATRRPLAQEIRFESAGESFAIQVVVDRLEHPGAGRLQAALFSPDIPVTRSPGTAPRSVVPPAPPPPVIAPPAESEIGNTEVKIEYELHRVRACTGESILVKRNRGGIKIDGVLEEPARKNEILQSLQALHLPAWVTTNLETVNEAAGRVPPSEAIGSASDPGSAPLAPAVSAALPAKGLPLDTYLTGYFSKNPAPAVVAAEIDNGKRPVTPQEQTAVFSSLLVSLSQQSYRHSWAIRRLAEKFGAKKDLSEENIWLVETMLRDHARELGAAIAQIHALLQPPFASGLPPAALDATAVRGSGWSGGDWASDAMTIFADADAINVVLFKLFASGEERQPERAVLELLSKIPALQRNIQMAKTLELGVATEKKAGLTPHADPN
jgi:hypothetical protein